MNYGTTFLQTLGLATLIACGDLSDEKFIQERAETVRDRLVQETKEKHIQGKKAWCLTDDNYDSGDGIFDRYTTFVGDFRGESNLELAFFVYSEQHPKLLYRYMDHEPLGSVDELLINFNPDSDYLYSKAVSEKNSKEYKQLLARTLELLDSSQYRKRCVLPWTR